MTKSTDVFSAGSLRKVLPSIVMKAGISANFVLGPSGVLRERIIGGERPDIFLSASLKHGQVLSDMGFSSVPVLFAQNELCLFGRSGAFRSSDVLENMLAAENRIGTSTPIDDPGGDYAFSVFDRAEEIRSGSRDILREKALTLVGGKNSPKEVGPHSPVYNLFENGKVDLFLGYRTTALDLAEKMEDIQVLDLPESLSVKAMYYAVVLDSKKGTEFLEALQTAGAKEIFEDCGFKIPKIPPSY